MMSAKQVLARKSEWQDALRKVVICESRFLSPNALTPQILDHDHGFLYCQLCVFWNGSLWTFQNIYPSRLTYERLRKRGELRI